VEGRGPGRYVRLGGDRQRAAVRREHTDGKPVNNGRESVESNLTCILGRTAAYRGGTATWDEMLDMNVKLEARLSL